MADGVGSGIPGDEDETRPVERQGGGEPAAQPEEPTAEATSAASVPETASDEPVAAADAPTELIQPAIQEPVSAAEAPTELIRPLAPAPPPAHVPVAQAAAQPPFFPPPPEGPFSADEPTSGGASGRIPRRGLIVAGGVLALAAAGGIAAAVTSGGSRDTASGGTGNGGSGSGSGTGGGSGAGPSPSPTYPAASFTTVPADGASGVDPSKPVTVSVANGTITSVQLSGGQETSGTLSADKSTWTSNGTLKLDASYHLQVEAAGQDGKTASKTVSFSTLKPSATVGVLEMWPGSGVSVGVGQPIRVQFSNYVPTAYRAAVEKACVVTTTPAVAGAWHWVETDMMDWRPQEYWATGTHVSVALNLSGVRGGQHQYFTKDHSLDFTIRSTDLRLVIDTKAFKATAYENGKVVRTFPIDTGSNDPRFITWSGVLAVLGKGNPVEMKGDYGNGDKYDEFVNWATQITYSGTYVHAAPWDGEIGRVNSSHGCIHASTSNATWFYNLAQVGDVVQVTGTNKTVALTNGFGDWTLSWPSWLSGSSYGATLNGTPTST
jgi:lipoprotein-anchoring transpeptidase ErfK/SrfK